MFISGIKLNFFVTDEDNSEGMMIAEVKGSCFSQNTEKLNSEQKHILSVHDSTCSITADVSEM